MLAEQRTGGVVWGGEDNCIGPRECFFNRLGGLRIGLFQIADTVDDVVPLGRKRSAKGLAHIAGTYHRNSHDLAPLNADSRCAKARATGHLPVSTGHVKNSDLLSMRPVKHTDHLWGWLQQYLAAIFPEISLSFRR